MQGRNFTVDDDLDAPRVGIVNQQLAQHYWPNQDPIGKRVRLNDAEKTWIQIVGVAKTAARYLFIAEPPSDFVYLPYRQRRAQGMIMVTQAAGDPAALAGQLREVVRSLDVNQPIFNVRTMEEFYRMRAVSIFNVLITWWAAMGADGPGPRDRRALRPGGLRRDAGARERSASAWRSGRTGRRCCGLCLRQGIVLALVGLVKGLAASVGAGELLAAAFPQGGGAKRRARAGVGDAGRVGVTFLARYIPARRASRINPMQALRYD